ncbi:MAG: DoxX family protein [Candidatus Omnitrophica bacterium]|nr:DoxX family protein [Candidatus Omnitrophota bacterium]
MFTRPLQPAAHSFLPSLALLVLRLIVGVAFFQHGLGKIQDPMGWMGPTSSVPPLFQCLAAISEFGGGIALVLGLLTPLFSLGIACTMAVAVHLHAIVMKNPFVDLGGGTAYELPLVFFGVALVFLTLGPGRFSLDALIFRSGKK